MLETTHSRSAQTGTSCTGQRGKAIWHLDITDPPATLLPTPRSLGSPLVEGGQLFLFSPCRSLSWPSSKGATSTVKTPQQSCPTCEKAEATVSMNRALC